MSYEQITQAQTAAGFGNYTEIFKDEQYCMEEIRQAREIFSNKNTTIEKFELMEKALGLVFLYAESETARHLAESSLFEATMRKSYFEMYVWKEQSK